MNWLRMHIPPEYPGDSVVSTLAVEGGSGSGEYASGTVINIVAPVQQAPLVFMGWEGDTAYVSDINALSTTVIMPEQNMSVSASYLAYYALKVDYGDGDGDYQEGDTVAIEAKPAGTGQEFDRWTGDTLYVEDVGSSKTILMSCQPVI